MSGSAMSHRGAAGCDSPSPRPEERPREMRASCRGSFDSMAVEGEEATPFAARRAAAPLRSPRFVAVAAGRRAAAEYITNRLPYAFNPPTALTKPRSQYAQPMGQGVPSRSSRKPPGKVTHFSMMGGLPNLSRDRPKNPPKSAAKTRGNNTSELHMQLQQGHFHREYSVGRVTLCAPSYMQLQQRHFQGEGFLDIGSKPALELFHDLQILHGFFGGNPPGNCVGPGNLWKIQKFSRP